MQTVRVYAAEAGPLVLHLLPAAKVVVGWKGATRLMSAINVINILSKTRLRSANKSNKAFTTHHSS
jgi:hypothetical protein